MKAIAFVVIAIGVLLFFLSGSPAYYNCSGTKTENGTFDKESVSDVSFKINEINWLNQIMFSRDDKGSAFFDSNRHFLHISSISDVNVLLKSATGERSIAVFDRVSRRLIINDGNYEYNVICRSVELGAI